MADEKKKKKSWRDARRRAAIKHQRAMEADRLSRGSGVKKERTWSKGRVLSVAFIIFFIILAYLAWQYSNSLSSSGGLRKAPLFSLADIDGVTVALENFTGKIVVLDFFYIRCGYCDDQLVELEEMLQSYSSDEIVMISISIDPEFDSVDRLRDYKTGPNQYTSLIYEVSWAVVRDTVGLAEDYGIYAAPTVVVVDQEGFMSSSSPFVGLTDSGTLEDEVDRLLIQ